MHMKYLKILYQNLFFWVDELSLSSRLLSVKAQMQRMRQFFYFGKILFLNFIRKLEQKRK